MNNHGSKKVELDSLIKSCENLSRYTMRRPALLHHELTASSLGNCLSVVHCPLPWLQWKGENVENP